MEEEKVQVVNTKSIRISTVWFSLNQIWILTNLLGRKIWNFAKIAKLTVWTLCVKCGTSKRSWEIHTFLYKAKIDLSLQLFKGHTQLRLLLHVSAPSTASLSWRVVSHTYSVHSHLSLSLQLLLPALCIRYWNYRSYFLILIRSVRLSVCFLNVCFVEVFGRQEESYNRIWLYQAKYWGMCAAFNWLETSQEANCCLFSSRVSMFIAQV